MTRQMTRSPYPAADYSDFHRPATTTRAATAQGDTLLELPAAVRGLKNKLRHD